MGTAIKSPRCSRLWALRALWTVILCLGCLQLACRVQEVGEITPPEPYPAAAKKSENAGASSPKIHSPKKPCFGIVDGEPTTDYPAVVFISLLRGGRSISSCTGFFVGPNLLVTASHCVDPRKYDGFVVSSLSEWDSRQGIPPGEQPRQVIAPTVPGAIPDGTRDIAAMVFDRDVAPATVPILDRRPLKGDRFTIVGYGLTNADPRKAGQDTKRVKRHGYNTVGLAINDTIRFVAPQAQGAGSFANGFSGAAPGDSGGPLFIDGKAAGVTSHGANFRGTTVENVYADLTGAYGRQVLDQAIAAGGKLGELEVKPPIEEGTEEEKSDEKKDDGKSQFADVDDKHEMNDDGECGF